MQCPTPKIIRMASNGGLCNSICFGKAMEILLILALTHGNTWSLPKTLATLNDYITALYPFNASAVDTMTFFNCTTLCDLRHKIQYSIFVLCPREARVKNVEMISIPLTKDFLR